MINFIFPNVSLIFLNDLKHEYFFYIYSFFRIMVCICNMIFDTSYSYKNKKNFSYNEIETAYHR